MAKRSITVAGHRTSISLEDAFWQALAEIAAAKGQSLPESILERNAGPVAGNGN